MKVSICIPTYNQAQYLKGAVLSALNQSRPVHEIIVSNDCSTDHTAELLASLSKEIPNLKVFNQSRNLGISKNTDSCLRAAEGNFVVRLDSDDLLKPEYVKRLSNLLMNHPDAAYAHSAIQQIDQFGNSTKVRKLLRNQVYQSGNIALKASIKGYKVAANIIMFRRTSLEEVNYLTGRPDYVEDFHLAASLAAKGYGNVYLDEILACYRVWVDSNKVRQKRKLLEINGLNKVFNDVLEPVFIKNGWDLNSLKHHKTSIACRQTDCLSWGVYTVTEKKELEMSLKKFSTSFRTRLFIKLNSKGHHKMLNYYFILKSLPKVIVKKIIFCFRNYNINNK